MTRHDTPEGMLRAWGGEPLPVEDEARVEARKDRIVPQLAAVMREAGRRRERTRAWRWAARGFAAAAAIAIAAVGLAKLRAPASNDPVPAAAATAPTWRAGGDVELVRNGRSIAATAAGGAAAVELLAGDVTITAATGAGRLQLVSGATLDVTGSTTMRLVASDAASERLEITRGGAAVSVPALGDGAELHVVTPGVSIEGRAAVFSVRVADVTLGAARTTVEVREGSIAIEHASGRMVLSAGQRWTTPEVEEAPAGTAPPPARGDAKVARGSEAASGSAREPTEAAASRLAEQNRMFQNAMALKRRGDDRGVVAALDELLARHSDSPLSQEARVERMRALARLGDKQGAARDARRYLAEHGDGFAKEEAREVALEPSSKPAKPEKKPKQP